MPANTPNETQRERERRLAEARAYEDEMDLKKSELRGRISELQAQVLKARADGNAELVQRLESERGEIARQIRRL